MQKPLFSVITVCKNAGSSIRRTLESVAAQTFKNFEYIIIDGASADDTLATLEKYSPPGTMIISEPDSGIANAMNKGIRQSSGELIIHLNGGDEFAGPDVLQKVATSYADDGWDWAVGSIDQINDRTGFIRRARVHRFDYEVLRRADFIPHQSTFVARRVFHTFGLFDESFRITMDYEFWLRIGQQVKPCILPFVVSRFHLGGISANYLRNYWEERRARSKNCPEPKLKGLLFDVKQITGRLGLWVASEVLTARGYDNLRSSKAYFLLRRWSFQLDGLRPDHVFSVVIERGVHSLDTKKGS